MFFAFKTSLFKTSVLIHSKYIGITYVNQTSYRTFCILYRKSPQLNQQVVIIRLFLNHPQIQFTNIKKNLLNFGTIKIQDASQTGF